MEKRSLKSFIKRFAVFALALACATVSFGASAYGACELCEAARLRAEQNEAEAAEKAKDPYGLGFVVEDSDRDLEVDLYHEGNIFHYLSMFGSDAYDLYFDHPASDVTAGGLKALVNENAGIPNEFKERVCEFVDAVTREYPEIDLRVLEHNLATMEISDYPPEYVQAQVNEYTAAYYSSAENKIYMSSVNGYAKHTWDYQILPHELCHAMRKASFEDDGLDVSVNSGAICANVVDEAFTSIVAGSLLGYEADELSYQPEVNIVRLMLECVDGYELADYYRQGIPYFASKLDETCGDHNYAMTVFRVMQAQHYDWQNADICRDRAAYHPLYDYLTRLYLDEHACPGMSKGEVDGMVSELVERVTYGVPVDYGYDIGEFYRFGQEYYAGKYGFDS